MKLIETLKGLYYYCQANKRIPIPLTKSGWITFLSLAYAWKYGFPEPLQFGMCVSICSDELKKDDCMRTATEMIEYHFGSTTRHLAAYSFFPTGDKRIITWDRDDFNTSIGWKATFEWRPTCS